ITLSSAERRVAIVTGSAKGIGAAVVERLARDGLTCVVNYRTSEREANTLIERVRAHVAESIALRADVSKPDEARALMEETLAHFGRIDVLVNNAGPWLVKTPRDTSVEEWQAMLDNNLSSTFYCCKFALPAMRERQSGAIVNFG